MANQSAGAWIQAADGDLVRPTRSSRWAARTAWSEPSSPPDSRYQWQGRVACPVSTVSCSPRSPSHGCSTATGTP